MEAEVTTEVVGEEELQPVMAVAEVPTAVVTAVPHAMASVATVQDATVVTATATPALAVVASDPATLALASVAGDAAAAVRMAAALTATTTMTEAGGEEKEEDDADKVANAKRPWTTEEDGLLMEAIGKFGTQRWPLIAGHVQRGRAGKQCRERWFNHLSPTVKKGDWTPEEDKVIQEGVAELGTKWSEIVKRLPGRTDNSIKNRYNSQLRREQRRARAQSNGAKSAETPEGASKEGAAEDAENEPASEEAGVEGPSAKRMRLETEATLAAAAAAVSAYAGSSAAEGDTPAEEAPPLVPADPD